MKAALHSFAHSYNDLLCGSCELVFIMVTKSRQRVVIGFRVTLVNMLMYMKVN